MFAKDRPPDIHWNAPSKVSEKPAGGDSARGDEVSAVANDVSRTLALGASADVQNDATASILQGNRLIELPRCVSLPRNNIKRNLLI
jgi:hypothetical protein